MATNVCEYLPAAYPDHAGYSAPQTAEPKVVYVLVALTALHFNNGLFALLRGSHGENFTHCTPINQRDLFLDVLHPGDVLIWRGDMKYFLSRNGGGRSVRDEIDTLASKILANKSSR